MRNGINDDLEAVSESIIAERQFSDTAKYHECQHRYMTSTVKREYWREKRDFYRDALSGNLAYEDPLAEEKKRHNVFW
jgi:hypothetical protein